MYRFIRSFFLVAAFVLMIFTVGLAANPTQIETIEITHQFGEQLNIQGKVTSQKEIDEVAIVIQSEDNTIIAAVPIERTENDAFFFNLDLQTNPIRAFSTISVWFDITFKDGSLESTEQFSHFYDDNRFEWAALMTDEFHIYWYDGDPDLGKKISNAAYDGTILIKNILEIPYTDAIRIYAYSSALELQETLMFSGQSAAWVAGHADPDLKMLAVSLPAGPEQAFEIKRQIPHELMHIFLYQKLGTAYTFLPRWFNEGLASSVELFPNPDYPILLNRAYERGGLLPLRDLCNSFPIDAANFQLAYAESNSFTRYLQNTYGNEKLDELVETYGQGYGCLEAVQVVFGLSLETLEMGWKQVTFNENQTIIAAQETFPFIILLGMTLFTPLILMLINFYRSTQKGRAEQSLHV